MDLSVTTPWSRGEIAPTHVMSQDSINTPFDPVDHQGQTGLGKERKRY